MPTPTTPVSRPAPTLARATPVCATPVCATPVCATPVCATLVRAGLDTSARSLIVGPQTFVRIDSTHRYLLALAARGAVHGSVVLADQQTAGRGRRGRVWRSPPGVGLALSLLWRSPRAPGELAAAGLAAGVAVATTLREFGVAEVGLKWPNDVYWRGAKLAGILTESAPGGGLALGIGVNVDVGVNIGADFGPAETPPTGAVAPTRPAADLKSALEPAPAPHRSRLAAALLNRLVAVLRRYEQCGFAGCLTDWSRYDLSRDRPVTLYAGDAALAGVARGLDADGALLVQTATGLRRCVAGELSLRLDDPGNPGNPDAMAAAR